MPDTNNETYFTADSDEDGGDPKVLSVLDGSKPFPNIGNSTSKKTSAHVWILGIYKRLTERGHRGFILAQAVFLLWGAYWCWYLPLAGFAVAFIALQAALISMHGEMRPSHKATWMLITGLFLSIEIRAIRHDTTEQNEQQKRTLLEETEHFGTIGKRIEDAIQDITGGDAFGFVVPQTFAAESFPLRVWNHGMHPLTGVSITIANTTNDPDWGVGFYKPIYVGNIGPNDSVPVPNLLISPRIESKSGQDHYWISIAAQNGSVSQSLYFRRDRSGKLPWAYSYQVSKMVLLNEATKIGATTLPANSSYNKDLLYRPWSDEIAAAH